MLGKKVVPKLILQPKEGKSSRSFGKRTAKSRFDSRWVLTIILGVTVLLSVFFYLKNRVSQAITEIKSPLIISNVPPEKKFDPSPVLGKIQALTQDLRGKYGVAVYRLDDGKEYGVNEDEAFPAASLMKLPVLATLYQEAEQGEINLGTEYILKEKDKVLGNGFLLNQPAGSHYTYRQIVEYMGHYSDNTAYMVMTSLLTRDRIQQTINNLGMKTTLADENQTSPADLRVFFRDLYQGKILNKDDRDEVLGFLTKTIFEDRIAAGVPANIRVAHKVGTDLGTYSDAGIIFAEKPFVLVIMSKDAKEDEAKEVLPKITEAVWNFENPSP